MTESVALHGPADEQALYAHRALQSVGRGLSSRALRRLDAAIGLLIFLADAGSGEVPNHGANDGGRALLLSTAAYRDFRPLLTLSAAIRGTPLPGDIVPDAELSRWIGTRLPPAASQRRDGIVTGASGWVAGRVSGCVFFLRAGTYRHRPSHLDALHLDVRIGGREIVTDAGTYAYNAPKPWNNGLAGAEVHNGPVLPGEELAQRGPRFLWLSWPKARLLSAEFVSGRAHLIAERPGVVRREVIVEEGCVRVRDSALSRDARLLQVTWLLHPDAHTASLDVDDAKQIPAGEGDVTGWYSATYGVRRRSLAIRVVRRVGEGGAGIATTIRP